MKKYSALRSTLILLVIASSMLFAQRSNLQLDTVKARRFDTGRMWTFDYPPVDYFVQTYDFQPSDEWLEHVRLSALRVPGCTASFVSPNGLIMTNHHCAESIKLRVQQEGEDLDGKSFYAATFEEERKVLRYYADQLVFITDVTNEIISAFESGKTEDEKIKLKDEKITELQNQYNEETGLRCSIISLYNGGRYSLYGYKRYEDVRLVFIPEPSVGEFGGDPDNFTYPRYDLDCAFLRVYDDGKPLNTEHYFKWSSGQMPVDDVIFTVGNPGSTDRLKTVAQLEYLRDYRYAGASYLLNTYFDEMGNLQNKFPDRFEDFEKIRKQIGNSQKSYSNTYKALLDPYLFARKIDFEKKFKTAVLESKTLSEKYGHLWDAISINRKERASYSPKIAAYGMTRFIRPVYYNHAEDLLKIAEEKAKPENERLPAYQDSKIDSTINSIFVDEIDELLEKARLKIQIDYVIKNLGKNDKLVQKLFKNYDGYEAVEYVLSNSKLSSKQQAVEFAKLSSEEILNSGDPFITFIRETQDEVVKLRKLAAEVDDTEEVYSNMLGQALFEVYGTNIPPDANFTLRISDGVMKSYSYNGTIAPMYTTYFGMYDRYYSFNKKYPWDLPSAWANPSSEFNMSTPLNFISTNDIVGGNSGSPVINRNAEVVGLAFDGNIQSLSGDFIFTEDQNRCVSVASAAILEALKQIYKAERIYNELQPK
ncbi:MAG: S46 family peptidase [Bacteroidota bacterium]